MLSERLFSIHKFLLELLRNRVTTSQKHCTTVSRCFGGFKIWYWNALNDLKVLRNLWKNVSIPFEWRSQRLALVLTALALELKKEGIDDTVCRCIVFYLGGEKKARQVFSAKKCKLDFQRGYYWFVREGGYVGGQKQKHFSPLGSRNSIFMLILREKFYCIDPQHGRLVISYHVVANQEFCIQYTSPPLPPPPHHPRLRYHGILPGWVIKTEDFVRGRVKKYWILCGWSLNFHEILQG